MSPTRFPPLFLGKIGKEWSYYDCSEKDRPARVGPVYKTKLEALADLENYVDRAGWRVGGTT